ILLSLRSLSHAYCAPRHLHSFPTRRSSDLAQQTPVATAWRTYELTTAVSITDPAAHTRIWLPVPYATDTSYQRGVQNTWQASGRSEEHTSELQSRENLVCRLLLEKKKK